MTRLKISAAVLTLIGSAALAQSVPVGVPNPAAVFCISDGGTFQITNTDDGQIGECLLRDGSQVDAWEYFREQAHLRETELPNPAAEFCVAFGGVYSTQTGSGGESLGICTINGQPQDAWELFRANLGN